VKWWWRCLYSESEYSLNCESHDANCLKFAEKHLVHWFSASAPFLARSLEFWLSSCHLSDIELWTSCQFWNCVRLSSMIYLCRCSSSCLRVYEEQWLFDQFMQMIVVKQQPHFSLSHNHQLQHWSWLLMPSLSQIRVASSANHLLEPCSDTLLLLIWW